MSRNCARARTRRSRNTGSASIGRNTRAGATSRAYRRQGYSRDVIGLRKWPISDHVGRGIAFWAVGPYGTTLNRERRGPCRNVAGDPYFSQRTGLDLLDEGGTPPHIGRRLTAASEGASLSKSVVPAVRIELTTYRLQDRLSALSPDHNIYR